MPATFESFGVKFLYPENWVVSARAPDEGEEGMTLELPGGGFFSLEMDDGELSDTEILEKIAATIQDEYEDIESEEIVLADASESEKAVEYRFFYLDLLVISRVILMDVDRGRLIAQFQAESRDFEANELVVAAILKQIRDQTA